MKRFKTVFMGTPEYAVPSLEALINEKIFEIAAVVTQPDKPVGRKKTLTAPPVKKAAGKNQIIDILQPEKIDSKFTNIIKKLAPELIVVVAYGQILPKNLLEIPIFGAVNVHFSLLPKYRGAVPVQSAILNNEKITGNTVMLMEEGLDSGPILSQEEILIKENETAGELLSRLSKAAAKQLVDTLKRYLNDEITPIEQDNSLATYCFRSDISKANAKINWKSRADIIHNLVRAMNPWPVAWTEFNNKRVKIYKTKISTTGKKVKPGQILEDNGIIKAACGQDAVEILEIQIEGKNKISGEEFLRGYGETVFR